MNLCDYEFADGIGSIRLDDGKVNAMSRAMIAEINAALDKAEQDEAITIISGREGIFSAGFDLKELLEDAEVAVELLKAGSALCQRLLLFPQPVITACTGHAYPMGAFLMMSADYRLGAEGDYGIGMNEVRIGIAAPYFAMELANSRLNSSYFQRTAILGEMYAPEEAAKAGFLDQVVPPAELRASALAIAESCKAIDIKSMRWSKHKIRTALVDRMKDLTEREITVEEFSRQ